jgi:chromosome partitioning protein
MKVVAVYSTKGGVGKTSAAVNLAWEAALSHRVLLWDLDPQGAATYLLEVKPKVKGGVDALVSGRTATGNAVRSTGYPNLDVLPADDSYRGLDLVFDAAKKSTQRLSKLLDTVAADYDVVVLDCPPGSSLVAENALYVADVVVVPLVPSPLSLRSLDQITAIVAQSARSAPILAFLSMVDRRKTAHRSAVGALPGERSEVTDLVVPASVVVERMGSERAPVASYAPRSEAALAYRELWARVRTVAKVKPARQKN